MYGILYGVKRMIFINFKRIVMNLITLKMTMFKSDLKDNGIEKLEKVEFKLHCTNSDDFLDSFESDVITINNP